MQKKIAASLFLSYIRITLFHIISPFAERNFFDALEIFHCNIYGTRKSPQLDKPESVYDQINLLYHHRNALFSEIVTIHEMNPVYFRQT